MLHDSVVGDSSLATIGRSGTAEEERAVDDHPWLDGVVPLDDLGVDVWDEEDGGEKSDSTSGTHGNTSDESGGLLVQAEVGGTLVDDGERADGAGDEEPERNGVDGPWDRVLANVDNVFDETKDDGTEATSDGRGHDETRENGTETLSVVPSPLDLGGTDSRNTDTSDGGDQRVCGGDVSRVLCAPHDPRGGTSKSAGEGEHLDTGIVLESGVGNDTILDGLGGPSTDSGSS